MSGGNWNHVLGDDVRPVDLNAIIEQLEDDINNQGEVGIYGGYGPPAAPVHHVVRLILNNADAIENGTGEYDEEADR